LSTIGRGRSRTRAGLHAIGSLLVGALLTVDCGSRAATAEGGTIAAFPRLMGMNIGAKNYEDLAYQQGLSRLDVVILGFYKGWKPPGYAPDPTLAMRKAVQAIKAQHPAMLVGQYTVLNEAYDDPGDFASRDLRDKLYESRWWLLNASGQKVQWTSQYSTWEINFTNWATPDAQGRRWPQWLAERNYTEFFRDIPEFDIVYLDNVMVRPRVKGDWDLDGVNDDAGAAKIVSAHHAGHAAHWKRLRELLPKALLIGNTDGDLADAQWRGQLDGAFLEGMMGEGWSIETWGGWNQMMARYRAVLDNTRPPKIVGFNVSGKSGDYRFFRYAYTSCLLDDGYFSFTDKSRGYSSVPWFDEYDYKLGPAISKPPTAAWSESVWRRDFQNGVVLVNPTTAARIVTVESGLRRLAGNQDTAVNNGSAVSRVTLQPKDGIVLRK